MLGETGTVPVPRATQPGKTNMVADWLSRAVEAYAVEEDQTPHTSLRQFFQDNMPSEEEEVTREIEDMRQSREEREGIREIDDIINNKWRQIRWVTKTSGLNRVESHREGTRRILVNNAGCHERADGANTQ